MRPNYKIVSDEWAGVTVTEPTDRRPANDNDTPIQEYIENVRKDPTCVCEQINDLESQGLLDGVPELRCPVHGW